MVSIGIIEDKEFPPNCRNPSKEGSREWELLTELNVALTGQENVVGLDITVNDALRVQVLQSSQRLSAD